MLLEKYSPKWMQDFEHLKRVMAAALQHIECTIEHVGSTAVPNLAAKPIIDIDVIYFH